jgi:hypothetical protein
MNTHPSSIYRRHHSPSRNFIRGGTNTISSLCYNTQVASAARHHSPSRNLIRGENNKKFSSLLQHPSSFATTKSFSTLEFHPRWTNISKSSSHSEFHPRWTKYHVIIIVPLWNFIRGGPTSVINILSFTGISFHPRW